MKKVLLFSFIVLFSLMNFHSDDYAATIKIKDRSVLTFDGAPDNGKWYTTRKVWVPKGGYLGVYGHNDNSDLGHTWLYFNVMRVAKPKDIDVTSQFWRRDPDWGYFLNEEEIVNKRVGPVTKAGYYYIKARCEFRWAPIGTGCDGTFTISSWY
jgi:hypothetical protein